MSLVASFLGYNVQTFLVFLAVFLYVFNYVKKSEWKGLPPGPLALPFLGSIPFLGLDMREPIRKFGKKYGDVFTIYLGSRRVVILNSYEVIKEAFIKLGNSFSERPPIYIVEVLTKGQGIICASGDAWREQRRFSHNVLRDFGLGRTLLQDKIMEEIKYLIKSIKEENGKSFNPKHIIANSVSNIICSLVFGRRFDYDDPKFRNYMVIMTESVEIVSNNGIISVFPWLTKLPGDLFKEKKLYSRKVYMDDVFREFITEHRDNMDTSRPPADFIDAYIRAIEEEKDKDRGSTLCDEQLVRVIGDLFTAGTETTGTTLLWGMIYMMRNPDVQDKVQKEIDEVLKGQEPRFQDRDKLPYTEACIFEIQRMGDITPFSVPHCTNEDVELRGYLIPKGTMIMPSVYSVHRDEDAFQEPFRFNPDRFIDDEGKLAKKEQLIPFSVGRRMCLGEGLARMELFLFFVTLMQNFSFKLPEGHSMPSLNGRCGITHHPYSFETCAILR